MSAVRVLLVTKGLGAGGAERLLCGVVAARDPARVTYEVAYVLPTRNHLVDELEALGATVHCLSGRGVQDPGWVSRLHRLVRTGGFDVVHVHAPLMAAVTRPVVRSLGPRRPRLVSTEHNGWSSFVWPTRIANALTFPLGDVAFAVSDAVRDSVPARHRGRVEVLVHGIPLQQARAHRATRAAVREELGIGADELVVGTVGNYRVHKAYPDLLAAARTVLDAEPRARFVAVGHGPLEAEIRGLHAELGLGERFRLLGYRPDAVRVMAAADVFTLASHHEGYPVAVMEAFALGLPVVATSVGGIPDAVRPGREGLLVPPRRPDELAGALLTLLRDEQLRGLMSAAAGESSHRFDIGRASAALEATYARLARRAVA